MAVVSSQIVADCVERIACAFDELHAVMARPEEVHFGGVRASFEKLEYTLAKKTTIDASFAFVAARDDAGRHVGSTRAEDYLTARLRIPAGEAHARMRNGEELFAVLEQPKATDPAQLDAQAAAEGDGLGDDAEAVARKRAELERADKERLARELAEVEAEKKRREAALDAQGGVHVAAHVLAAIEAELRSLNKHAVPGHKVLRAQAVAMAQHRDVKAVRWWLREQIRTANRKAVDPAGKPDPYAAIRKRWLKLESPDHDGGVGIRGYLDPATAALLAAALSPARNSGSANVSPAEDTRTYGQRMVDQLATVVADFEDGKQSAKHGLGSIMITTTTAELANLTADSKLPTTTGVELSPLDVLRLGSAQHDLMCVVDEHGLPLELGRSQRTASLWQKLALAATELVCTHPECDRPWIACDVHHLQAWAQNGPTDIRNLTLLCRRHHVDNNDQRDGSRNMGHAARCSQTGRVGHKYAGNDAVVVNSHPNALKAPARKLVRNQTKESIASAGSAGGAGGVPLGFAPPGSGPLGSGPPGSAPPGSGLPRSAPPGSAPPGFTGVFDSDGQGTSLFDHQRGLDQPGSDQRKPEHREIWEHPAVPERHQGRSLPSSGLGETSPPF